jgi:hypothetical protein
LTLRDRKSLALPAFRPIPTSAASRRGVLAAIAEGNTIRGGIVDYLQRKSTALADPPGVLHDAGLYFPVNG